MKSVQPSPAEVDLIARIHRGDRDALAQYVLTLEPLIRRRISGKLGPRMRRVFDSQDIFATVLRRVDLYTTTHELRATTENELLALVMKVANAAVVDKVRLLKRLQRSEDDPELVQLLCARLEQQETNHDEFDGLLGRVFDKIEHDPDRRILWLWLSGLELKLIGSVIGMEPSTVRKRWQRLREQLREQMALEATI